MPSSCRSAGAGAAVWLVDLARSAAVLEAFAAATGCLSTDDAARADAIPDAAARRERRTAYAALRLLIERAAGAGTRGTAFERSAEGKPSLAGMSLPFSLSHTDGFALLAVGGAGPLGVDIERPRRLALGEHHRRRIIAAGAGLASNADDAMAAAGGDAALIRAWTRLEALAKARGDGIARVLTSAGARGAALPGGAWETEIAARARGLAEERALVVTDLVLPAGLVGAFAGAAAPANDNPRSFPTDWPSLLALLPAGALA